MNLDFKVNALFEPLFTDKSRYFLLMGGRGRGASTAVSQYVTTRLVGGEYTRCALMRANHSDIRLSLWRDLLDRIEEQKARSAFKIAENDMRAIYGRNFVQAIGFRASSHEHTAKLKSLANFNVVVIEEAEEVGEREFDMLDDSLRTVKGDIKVILVFNPPHKNHWLMRTFFDLEPTKTPKFSVAHLKENKNAVHIGGTFYDNLKNLDEHTIQKYKDYEHSKPDYFHQVIQGLVPDELRGKIFSGWRQIENIPFGAKLVAYGLDGGWYPDPTALVAIYSHPQDGYIIDELLFGTEIDNETIAATIRQTNKDVLTNADLDDRSIDSMKKLGIHITKVEKAPDSVKYRIKLTARQKISVTRRSENVWRAYENYAWQETKDGDPVGKPDHYLSDCMDATMYGIQSLPQAESEYEDELDKILATRREYGVPEKKEMPIR